MIHQMADKCISDNPDILQAVDILAGLIYREMPDDAYYRIMHAIRYLNSQAFPDTIICRLCGEEFIAKEREEFHLNCPSCGGTITSKEE